MKTRRSDIEIPEGRIAGRLQRWDRIVMEASKQCRRSSAPRIHEPQAFPDFLSMEGISSCARFMLYEKASDPWCPDPRRLLEGVVLCIGPEGGWEDGEVEQAKAAGWEIFSLGPWILRAETAAIAAVSIVQHHINLLRRRIPALVYRFQVTSFRFQVQVRYRNHRFFACYRAAGLYT